MKLFVQVALLCLVALSTAKTTHKDVKIDDKPKRSISQGAVQFGSDFSGINGGTILSDSTLGAASIPGVSLDATPGSGIDVSYRTAGNLPPANSFQLGTNVLSGLNGYIQPQLGTREISTGPSFNTVQLGATPYFNNLVGVSQVPQHIRTHEIRTISQPVPVPVPQPYPVTVTKHVPVPQPYPVPVRTEVRVPVHIRVPVEVPKPYPVRVPHPYPVPVQVRVPVEVPKPYPVTVTRTVHVPVEKPVYIRVPHPVRVPVPQPYPVAVPQPVAVRIPSPVIVKVPHIVNVGTASSPDLSLYSNGGLSYNVGSEFNARTSFIPEYSSGLVENTAASAVPQVAPTVATVTNAVPSISSSSLNSAEYATLPRTYLPSLSNGADVRGSNGYNERKRSA